MGNKGLYFVLISFIFVEVFSLSCPESDNKPPISNISNGPTLRIEEIKTSLKEISLGIEGIVYERTLEIDEELKNGVIKPFKQLIRGNLADPQIFGQKPLTFVRQLLPLVTFPHLLDLQQLDSVFPSDIRRKAKTILSEVGAGSIGTYSSSWGIPLIRKHIASFITTRDGGIPSDWRDIGFTNGVYDGTFTIMELLQHDCSGKQVGVMTSLPVYPLFSLAIEKFGFRNVAYRLNSSNNWSLDVPELERAYDEAVCNCNCQIRAIVIINPGNPTGVVLRRKTIEEIIQFAHARNLLILADEIYQETVLSDNLTFLSLKKVLREMDSPFNRTELISFHGVSKGYFAESGLRGGYFELTNIDSKVKSVLTKLLNLKLCSNILGQVVMDCLAAPPQPGDESYNLYIEETSSILNQRRIMSRKLLDGINSIPGLHALEIEAGLVIFIKLTLPSAAFKEAQAKGIKPDELYALELLELTGLATTPGSAFSLPDDQPYIRIVFPLDSNQLDLTVNALRTFQPNFARKYES